MTRRQIHSTRVAQGVIFVAAILTLLSIPSFGKTDGSGRSASAGETFVPHVATGNGWTTALILQPFGTVAMTVELRFYDEAGLAKTFRVAGSVSDRATVAIPVAGTREVTIETDRANDGLSTGYISMHVTGVGPSSPLHYTIVYYNSIFDLKGSISRRYWGLVNSGSVINYDLRDGKATGVAIVRDPTWKAWGFKLRCLDHEGQIVGEFGLFTPNESKNYKSFDLEVFAPSLKGKKGMCLLGDYLLPSSPPSYDWNGVLTVPLGLLFEGRSFIPFSYAE